MTFVGVEFAEEVGALECFIYIEEHDVELAIVTVAEQFGVIVVGHPILRTYVKLGGEVVAHLVNVAELTNLFPYSIVRRIGGKIIAKVSPFLICDVITSLHSITTAVLKLVNFVCVDAIVGVGVVFVGGLTEVEHELVLAVDEHVGWLISLTVNIEATAGDNLMNGSIHDTAFAVVTTVAHDDGLASGIGFLRKDRVGEIFLTI